MRINTRSALVVVLTFLLTACTSRPTDSVGWRTERIEHWQATDNYVRLQYPVVIGADAERLNPVIQRWIGANCGDGGTTVADARACLSALVKDCSDTIAATSQSELKACAVNITTDVWLDAAGLLAINMDVTSWGGGAHPQEETHDLNLDLRSGRALQLGDLLDHWDAETLALRITHALRTQRHIGSDQTLMQAGFFVDHLPVPPAVMALPQGLLFTYGPYEIAPGVEGQQQVLVPYDELSGMIRSTGPLPRLHGLRSPAN
jgi:Protein of unknown function (DUF3298)